MKRRRALTFAIAVAVSIMCITPALAFSDPNLSINYYCDTIYPSAQFINEAYIGGNERDDYYFCTYLQVNMYVYRTYEFAPEQVLEIVCEYDNYKDDPTSWISTSFSGSVQPGYYMNEGVAVVYYFNDPYLYKTEGAGLFSHLAEDSRQSDHLETEDLTALCRDSGIAYGIDIASDFGGIPNDYTAYYNSEIKNVVGTLDYLDIRHALQLCFGDKAPTYFVSPDETTIIAVKQDSDGNNYAMTFAKDSNDEWEPLGDFLMAENEEEVVFGVTDDASTFDGYAPEDHTYVKGADLCGYLDSVKTYLSIRKMVDGNKVLAYFISPDRNMLIVIQENEAEERTKYTLEQIAVGEWVITESQPL